MTKLQPWKSGTASAVDLTDEQYFAEYNQFMSAHNLQTFRHSPMAFKRKQSGEVVRQSSAAYAFGTAAHHLVLEGPDVFHANYSVGGGPVNPKTDKPYGASTNRYKEWLAELAKAGKEPISESDYYKIGCMNNHIHNHPTAAPLFETGKPEVAIRGHLYDVKSQSKIDWLDEKNKRIVDLKTCAELGSKHTSHFPCKFAKDAQYFGYFQQLAFYRSMVAALTGENYEVFIVAVEKTEPFEVGVFRLSKSTLDGAEEQNRNTLTEYKACLEAGDWPSRFNETITL